MAREQLAGPAGTLTCTYLLIIAGVKNMLDYEVIKMKYKEIEYPCKILEISITEYIVNKRSNYKRGRKGNKADVVEYKYKQARIYRVKKELRQLALLNGLNRMLTLTFKDNIQDVEEADYYFKRFIENARRSIKAFKRLRYIAVREEQERGAIHYHVLINKYIPQKDLLNIWTSLIGGGSVNIKRYGLKAINYVLKYIEKNLNDLNFTTAKGFSSKAYLCSKNLNRNIEKHTIAKVFTVIKNKEKAIIKDEAIKQVLKDIERYKIEGKVIWDNITEYQVGEVKKECRSILINLR